MDNNTTNQLSDLEYNEFFKEISTLDWTKSKMKQDMKMGPFTISCDFHIDEHNILDSHFSIKVTAYAITIINGVLDRNRPKLEASVFGFGATVVFDINTLELYVDLHGAGYNYHITIWRKDEKLNLLGSNENKEDKYIIQYGKNAFFNITAKPIAAGADIVLYHGTGIGNIGQEWILDEEVGVIRNSKNRNLVLSIKGRNATAGAQIVLSQYSYGDKRQQWDWTSIPGTITSGVDSNYAIDNRGQNVTDMNPIILYPLNQTPAQNWILLPAQSFESVNVSMFD